MPNKTRTSKMQVANFKTPKNGGPVSKRMPVFTCNCGTAILIVPDVAAMSKAIRQHLPQHRKATGDCLSEDTLTQEIIKTLSQSTFK